MPGGEPLRVPRPHSYAESVVRRIGMGATAYLPRLVSEPLLAARRSPA